MLRRVLAVENPGTTIVGCCCCALVTSRALRFGGHKNQNDHRGDPFDLVSAWRGNFLKYVGISWKFLAYPGIFFPRNRKHHASWLSKTPWYSMNLLHTSAAVVEPKHSRTWQWQLIRLEMNVGTMPNMQRNVPRWIASKDPSPGLLKGWRCTAKCQKQALMLKESCQWWCPKCVCPKVPNRDQKSSILAMSCSCHAPSHTKGIQRACQKSGGWRLGSNVSRKADAVPLAFGIL